MGKHGPPHCPTLSLHLLECILMRFTYQAKNERASCLALLKIGLHRAPKLCSSLGTTCKLSDRSEHLVDCGMSVPAQGNGHDRDKR